MNLEFDPVKRDKTLQERNLDFGLNSARRGAPHHQYEESK